MNKTEWESGIGSIDDEFLNAHHNGWQNIDKSAGTLEEVQESAKREVGDKFIVRTEEYQGHYKYRFKRKE